MKRILTLAYGGIAYAMFLLSFLYLIGFVENILVPRSIDAQPTEPFGTALAIDLALVALFAVQHSVMARPAFKRVLTRFVAPTIERSTYVLASSLALFLLCWQWRPLGGGVWNVASPVGRAVLYTTFVAGLLLVFASTFVINHFDLFGLRQTWRHFRGQPQQSLRFVTPVLYRIVRHPLYLGLLTAFWSTPTMTISHLVFAIATTGYVLVGIRLEERDLLDVHPEYASYRSRVPMLVPVPRRRETLATASRVTAA